MKDNKRIFIFIGLVAILCAIPKVWGQPRLIAHITCAGGNFQTEIFIGNFTDTLQQLTLTAFNVNGEKIATVNDAALDAQTVLATTPYDLFKTNDVSHFLISNDSKVAVSVAYKANLAFAGPVHLVETRTAGYVYRLFLGDAGLTWDGVAAVNLGSNPTRVTVRQMDDKGAELAAVQDLFNGPLLPNAKGLSVLSALFDTVVGATLEIRSPEPIALMALRGTLASDFLWQNSAILVE